jgi:hypothetical protein
VYDIIGQRASDNDSVVTVLVEARSSSEYDDSDDDDSDDNDSDDDDSDDNDSDDVSLMLSLRRSKPLGWPLQLLGEEKQVDQCLELCQ